MLKFITYGRDDLRPDEASILRVKNALHGVDRGDEVAVWDALLSEAPQIGEIPIFDMVCKKTNLTTKELEKWKIVGNPATFNTETLHNSKLPLPGNQNYVFTCPEEEDMRDVVDAWEEWFCEKPLVDMAEMFVESNGEIVDFNDWLGVISILSKLSFQLRGSNEVPTNDWFQNQIDRSVPEIISFGEDENSFYADGFEHFLLPTCKPHPFIRYASELIGKSSFKIFSTEENEHLPIFWNESSKKLGDLAACWHYILSNDDENPRATKYTPALVVAKQRLNLMVRDEYGYSLLPVPQKIEIWRLLMSLSLYHPSTEQNAYLRAIQWEIMCEEEPKFIAATPEIKALEFLAKTCESLGGLVEIRGDYFVVEGNSSLFYSVKPVGRMPHIGIEVRAFRVKEQTEFLGEGIRICIVFDDFNPLPLGDKIAAYLLVLCNDQGSASNISTLGMLQHSWFQLGFENNDEGWKSMASEFPHGFQEDEPDWDEWDDDEMIYDTSDSDCTLDVIQEPELDSRNHPEEIIDNDTWELEAEVRGESHCI
tara:strand:- start:1839 stop:3449 length:1611 start_codon:yes stop_codon:yes gene_type:complete